MGYTKIPLAKITKMMAKMYKCTQKICLPNKTVFWLKLFLGELFAKIKVTFLKLVSKD
jgi:hypothetical protein